jgi:hypothetical protein
VTTGMASARINTQTKKALVVLLAMASVYMVLTCARAWHKPFWFDEINTLIIADQHSMGDIWRAETAGFELNPPVVYLLTKLTRHIGERQEFFARLPEIVGYLIMMGSLCLFIGRRLPLSFAVPAVSFALLSEAYEYSYEARAYGIELGCAGVALVAWQAATDVGASKSRRRLGLGLLSLALCIALLSHVYSVLLYIPICAGELGRTWSRKRIDFALWTALILSLAPLVLYPALLATSHKIVWGTAVFAPTPRRFLGAYALLLRQALPPLGALLITLALFANRNRAGVRRAAGELFLRIPLHELIAAAAFTMIPACGFAMARFLKTAYVSRHGMSGTLGLAILFAFVVYVLCAARSVWMQGIGVATLASFIASFALSARAWPNQAPSGNNNEPFVIGAAATGRPVVIAEGRAFLQFSYYFPREAGKQVVYLDDPKLAIRFTGTDGMDTPLLLVRPWLTFPARIEDYGEFVAHNHRFWLFSWDDPLAWVERQLRQDGAVIHPAGGPYLYDVLIEQKARVPVGAN